MASKQLLIKKRPSLRGGAGGIAVVLIPRNVNRILFYLKTGSSEGMQGATKCPQESHTQLLSSDIGFRMKPTEVGTNERLSVLLSESNVYLSTCRLFRVPILSSLPPHLRAKAQKRRGAEN